MERDYSDLEAWIASYVNSSGFCRSLESAIERVEKPETKAKLMLDLIDYIKPKLKTQDAPTPNEEKEITVIYETDDAKAGA